MEERTGIEELRLMVNNFDSCREDFLDRFTLEQLVQIHRMWLASEWDIYPDTWTDRQVKQALAGKPPRWSARSEKPLDAFEINAFESVDPEMLPPDLRAEWRIGKDTAWRVVVEGQAERVHVLLVPDSGRAGVAWGSDATWIDYKPETESACDVARIVLNDADETERRA